MALPRGSVTVFIASRDGCFIARTEGVTAICSSKQLLASYSDLGPSFEDNTGHATILTEQNEYEAQNLIHEQEQGRYLLRLAHDQVPNRRNAAIGQRFDCSTAESMTSSEEDEEGRNHRRLLLHRV